MKINNEIRVGMLVVFVIASLVAITLKAGDFNFAKEGYEIKVHFYNIDGVEESSPVRLNGMEVGLVKKMEILYGEDTRMELTLSIEEGIKMHEGCSAYVKNMGLFGEKYIGLTIGDTKKSYVQPGAVISGIEPANFEKMMADGEVIAANIKDISVKVKERLDVNQDSIDEIVENLRVASGYVSSISANIDERLDVNKGHIDNILTNFDSASENFEEMSYDLKLNPWKLMYKRKDKKVKKAKSIDK